MLIGTIHLESIDVQAQGKHGSSYASHGPAQANFLAQDDTYHQLHYSSHGRLLNGFWGGASRGTHHPPAVTFVE